MLRSRRFFPLTAALIPLATAADTVTLNNGDRLTGNIVAMSDGELVIETSYSGEISVPWGRVDDLETDEPIRLRTNVGDAVSARVVGIRDGRLELADRDESPAPNAIDAINPPEPGVEFSGFADAGATISRGNTDASSFNVGAESTARTANNRYIVGGEYYLEQDEGEDTAENARVFGRYARFLSEQWFLGANLSFEHDPFRDLDLRSTAGAGIGYQPYESDELSLALETGANLVHDDFDEADDETFAAGRFAVDYRQRLFDGPIVFHNSELLPPLDAPTEFVFTSRSGLRMPLFAGLNGTFQLNFDFDNDPVQDRDKEDVIYTFKVGYNW